MVTPAQIEANRRNALKSTGPRTERGKAVARRNALVHGLAAETLTLPVEAEAVAARVAAWSPTFGPSGEYDDWLMGEMALSSLRLERCQVLETALRDRSAARAASSWDEDREEEVEILGRKLTRSPSVVMHQLRATKQGCAWLLARWEGLQGALDAEGGWDESQVRLAKDLLGTPKELRNAPGALDGDRRALVGGQVALLAAKHSGPMAELDDLDRDHAEIGFGRDLDKPVALVRRYEGACARRMEWARKQVGKGRPPGMPASRPSPRLPEPEPKASPAPAPIPAPAPVPTAVEPPQPSVAAIPTAHAPRPASPPTLSKALPAPASRGPRNRRERRALKSILRKV